MGRRAGNQETQPLDGKTYPGDRNVSVGREVEDALCYKTVGASRHKHNLT